MYGLETRSTDFGVMPAAASSSRGKLHRATSAPPSGAVGTELGQRLRDWIARADVAGLISQDRRHRLSHSADVLANTPMDGAVCHLDYQPRNWLLGDVFGLCDFERMRRDARIRDFARLEFRRWQAAPNSARPSSPGTDSH